MGLLDKIEKNEQKHLVKDGSFELKINYLNAVAFFMAIDDNVTDGEEKEFVRLIELLDCEDAKDDLLDFLHHPDENEFENIFDSINKENFLATYLLELLTFKKDGLSELEDRFVNILFDKYEYNKREKELLLKIAQDYHKKQDLKSVFMEIYIEELFSKEIQKIQKFYKFTHKDKRRLEELNQCREELESLKKELEGLKFSPSIDAVLFSFTKGFTPEEDSPHNQKIKKINQTETNIKELEEKCKKI